MRQGEGPAGVEPAGVRFRAGGQTSHWPSLTDLSDHRRGSSPDDALDIRQRHPLVTTRAPVELRVVLQSHRLHLQAVRDNHRGRVVDQVLGRAKQQVEPVRLNLNHDCWPYLGLAAVVGCGVHHIARRDFSFHACSPFRISGVSKERAHGLSAEQTQQEAHHERAVDGDQE